MTAVRGLPIELLPEPLSICRLAADAPIPAWATARAFFSITRSAQELSVVCATAQVPEGFSAGVVWRAFMLRGPLDMALVGITLAVAEPLARAGVSIMPIATFDTDYVLVRGEQLDGAIDALRAAGHTVHVSVGPVDRVK